MAKFEHMRSICPTTHLDIFNSSISNFAFSILFDLHVHCICASWACSKTERAPKLNLQFGPRWTFGPRRVFCGPRRAVTPFQTTPSFLRTTPSRKPIPPKRCLAKEIRKFVRNGCLNPQPRANSASSRKGRLPHLDGNESPLSIPYIDLFNPCVE